MRLVSPKIHDRYRKASETRLDPDAFGDPENIAEAMAAALPLGRFLV